MNDERLARRAAGGDRRAFEAIFRRYHQALYRFCLATTGDPQDAQDALQNTMLKALRALPGEEREIKLKPWLYRIARNESVEVLRRRRESAELDPEQPAGAPEIAETAAARERLRHLLADLGELPERQRAALTMRELAGLEFAEISAALGTSDAVARQTLYEARLSLRQMEAGREMDCDAVTRALSDADGRVTRRRDVRAHLRGCAECRAFRDGISARRDGLASIAPLPAAASAALLHAAIGGGAAATSAIVKSAATVAIVAAVGVTAADRGGVIDVPLPGRDRSEQAAPAVTPPPRVAIPSQAETATEARAIDRARAGARVATARRAAGRRRETVPKGVTGDGRPEAGAPVGGETTTSPSRGKQAARHRSPSRGDGNRSHGQGRGRGRPLPAASSHGQQTAAAHTSPTGKPSPGTPRGTGASKPASTPPPTPSSPKKEAVPPDKPAHGPFEADEPAAEPPAADKSKEAG